MSVILLLVEVYFTYLYWIGQGTSYSLWTLSILNSEYESRIFTYSFIPLGILYFNWNSRVSIHQGVKNSCQQISFPFIMCSSFSYKIQKIMQNCLAIKLFENIVKYNGKTRKTFYSTSVTTTLKSIQFLWFN